MKTAILTCCLLALAPAARAQVPFAWEADGSAHSAAAPARKDVYRGESVALQPSWNAPTNGAAFALYWQTNGMGSAWWSDATNAFRWTPARDCGAAEYTLFIRCQTAAGSNYRANARLRMLFSPGFVPSILPPPSYYPTLAAELAPLVAPLLEIDFAPAYTYADSATNRLSRAITNEAALRASADAHLQEQITLLSECGSITGQVGSASLSDSALRLASADSNWWVSVEAGTATLWRVQRSIVSPSSTISFSADFYTRFDDVPNPGVPMTVPFPWSQTNQFGLWTAEYDGTYYAYVTFATQDGPCIWQGESPGGLADGTVLYSITDDSGTATIHVSEASDITTTNAVGTYVTAASLAAALSVYAPSSDLAEIAAASSNAWLLAGSAYDEATNASARIVLATNAVMRALISTNAWLEANAASNTLSVYVISTNGTNVVTVGGVTGIDPAATNLLWIALSSGLSSKAPRAWGALAPDGTANPDPEFQTWLNAPATVFASGYTWTTYGLYAAIVSTGMVAQATGSNGMWRISVDSTNYLGVVQGGSVIVGARANSLVVHDGGTSNGYAELTYDYDGANFPTLFYTASLQSDFTQVGSAQWTDNLDGSATVVAPATSARGFWRAMTSSSYSYALESTMPFRPIGGVIGATNAPPVRYDCTVEISSGGHTYRIPAQIAD